MSRCLFISHPDVVIDPAVAVPNWHLSERGRARMAAFARSAVVKRVSAIAHSAEVKAMEAGAILGEALRLVPAMERALHENDRSATGYLPSAEFESVADLFFAHPTQSIRGWERAIDAQARIVGAVERVAAGHHTGDLAVVAHGGVGALLLCHLSGWEIDRQHDQPGQGSYFAFDLSTLTVLHGWRLLENLG